MRKIFLLFLITFISSLSFAQTYYLCGSSSYDCSSTSADIGYKLVFDKDYYLYSIGWGTCLPGRPDMLIGKYTCVAGSPFISQLNSGRTTLTDVDPPEAAVSDGNYIYAVSSIGLGAESHNIVTVKFNRTCGIEWYKVYDCLNNELSASYEKYLTPGGEPLRMNNIIITVNRPEALTLRFSYYTFTVAKSVFDVEFKK